MPTRFSDQFGISKAQADLEFVDIPVNADIPLYVDPYAFKIGNDSWSIECNDLIVDFFDKVIDCIRTDNDSHGRALLGHLREPPGTNLGVSSGRPQGRGVGAEKSADLFSRLKNSKAAKSGKLRDLSDCELLIPRIGPDTISDISINVIRAKLVEFTKDQCNLHNVPLQRIAAGVCWSSANGRWESRYAELPVHAGRKLILVPKQSVRYHIAADHQEYYNDFVLRYLQAEHIRSGSALVEVLKSGKRRVTKKSLKEKYPCSKDLLFEFSENNPDVLRKYKAYLPQKSRPIDDRLLEDIVAAACGKKTVTIIAQPGSTVMNQTNIVRTNVGGAVGSGATVNARDISLYQNYVAQTQLPADVKDALLEARTALESVGLPEGDKNDVADDIGKITHELAQPTPEPGRIVKLWGRIKNAAPVVAVALQSAKMVFDIVTNNPPSP